jgi:hypothetical protein
LAAKDEVVIIMPNNVIETRTCEATFPFPTEKSEYSWLAPNIRYMITGIKIAKPMLNGLKKTPLNETQIKRPSPLFGLTTGF